MRIKESGSLLALLAILASCSVVEPDTEPRESGIKLTLNSEVSESKSVISTTDGINFTPSWEGTETMALWLAPGGSTPAPADVAYELDNPVKGEIASFSGTVDCAAGEKEYFGLVPSSAYSSKTASDVTVTIPVSQATPDGSVIDPAADILLAQHAGISVTGTAVTVDGVRFAREVALVKIVLDNSAISGVLPDGAAVSAIQLTTESTGIAGSYTLDWETMDPVGAAGAKSVTVTPETPVAFEDGKAVLYMALARVPIPSQELTFTITTDIGTITASRTPSKTIDLTGGKAQLKLGLTSSDTLTPAAGVWYVSPSSGNDSFDGKSTEKPFKTILKAIGKLEPGHTIRLMPGEYGREESWRRDAIELTAVKSGTEGNYVTIMAHDPANRPRIHGTGDRMWDVIAVSASWVILDGLEVYGDNSNPSRGWDLSDAENNAQAHQNGSGFDWSVSANYNCNGISIGPINDNGEYPSHVIVRNCIVHDMPGGGIGAGRCDYVTIENNKVYNNAWFCMYACSGISVIHSRNSDGNTGYKMIVRNNIVANNYTQVKWYRSVGGTFDYSDGNGIIIDINSGAYDGGPYNGRTLVCNNVSFGNGGSGIHSYQGSHVDIINNTAYRNGWRYDDRSYADIYAHGSNCTDVNIVNNIMYGREAGATNKAGKEEGIRYDNNLMFGAGEMHTSEGEYFYNGMVANPLFVSPSSDLAVADFHLSAGSPADGLGKYTDYMPATDIEGKPRNTAPGSICVGAYQL